MNDASVQTVEHLLSALAGMHVDNAEIEIEGPELPALDGSALPWTDQIRMAGVEELQSDRELLTPESSFAISVDATWYLAVPAKHFHITCVTQFDHPLLGTEIVSHVDDPDTYSKQIAPARTFGFRTEIESLLSRGLIKGGTPANALIVEENGFSEPLRLPQECTRHKVLDLVGDLSLAGCRIGAAITAIKPSHRSNVVLAARLSSSMQGGPQCSI